MLCKHSIQSIADEGMHGSPVLGGQDLDLRSHCGFYMNSERGPCCPVGGRGLVVMHAMLGHYTQLLEPRR